MYFFHLNESSATDKLLHYIYARVQFDSSAYQLPNYQQLQLSIDCIVQNKQLLYHDRITWVRINNTITGAWTMCGKCNKCNVIQGGTHFICFSAYTIIIIRISRSYWLIIPRM